MTQRTWGNRFDWVEGNRRTLAALDKCVSIVSMTTRMGGWACRGRLAAEVSFGIVECVHCDR